jgi:succinyl-CoA:acetate CoA-transferase
VGKKEVSMASSSTGNRVLNSALAQRLMSGEDAAALIQPGSQIGMSGFTGSGYPKAVPMALARRVADAHLRGQRFKVNVFTGASTGPELDGALAMSGAMQLRMPYQSDPITRKLINAGEMQYIDIHLSHVAQLVEYGFMGKLDLAIIEVTAVLEDGRAIPSTSIGNNQTWIDCAEKIILEVNSSQPMELEGMHDLYYGLGLPPYRDPIPLTAPNQRIGEPYLKIPLEKVVAVVYTDVPDRSSSFKAPDECSRKIAANILDFLSWEVKKGRIPASLLPLQSGVGNIANAVLAISGSDRLYRGHPGWPGELAAVGQDAERIGHGVLAKSRGHYSTDAAHRRFQGPNRAALAGDIESPWNHPASRRDCDERDDRNGHLWQCELDPHHGVECHEWHRWVG